MTLPTQFGEEFVPEVTDDGVLSVTMMLMSIMMCVHDLLFRLNASLHIGLVFKKLSNDDENCKTIGS